MLTTGFQLAAARALIGMDQVVLAERAGLSANTIRSMEKPGAGPVAGRATNVQAVQRALEAAGVEFLNHGTPGVRLRPLRIGEKVKLKAVCAHHAVSLGLGADEAATIEALDHEPGWPAWGKIRLRTQSGGLTSYVELGLFERAP